MLAVKSFVATLVVTELVEGALFVTLAAIWDAALVLVVVVALAFRVGRGAA